MEKLPLSLALLSLLAALFAGAGCGATRSSTDVTREAALDDPERRAVERVLDEWSRAATEADAAGYFGRMGESAIFLGTDASERWTREQFRAYCEPYFARGQGWTYTPRERHVFVAGDLAWFDELLWNEKYGDCRGTGVLRRADGEWRIVHYSLSLLIPNERAGAVLELLRTPSGAD